MGIDGIKNIGVLITINGVDILKKKLNQIIA